jgi:hypothetical protein
MSRRPSSRVVSLVSASQYSITCRQAEMPVDYCGPNPARRQSAKLLIFHDIRHFTAPFCAPHKPPANFAAKHAELTSLVALSGLKSEFFVTVDDARLMPGRLQGAATSGGHTIAWDLSYAGESQPLFLLPLNRYQASLPKAKSLVALPLACFNGALWVDGEVIEVSNWVGSQNHNWGAKHTDLYAWGQVAGFDNEPDGFLEVATARLKIGPMWTPLMTPIVLRHRGEELTLNALLQTIRARASFDFFTWHFCSSTAAVSLERTISAPREAFVGLRYYNPQH